MCCKKRRGLFPGEVLVCPVCDFSHEGASVMPNESKARDVPDNVWVIYTDGRMGNG